MNVLWPRAEAFEHAAIHVSVKFTEFHTIADFLSRLYQFNERRTHVSFDLFSEFCRQWQMSDDDSQSFWWRSLTYIQTARTEQYNIDAELSMTDLAILVVLQLFLYSKKSPQDSYAGFMRETAPGASSPRAGLQSPRNIMPSAQRSTRDPLYILNFMKANFENFLRAMAFASGLLSVDSGMRTADLTASPKQHMQLSNRPLPGIPANWVSSLSLVLAGGPSKASSLGQHGDATLKRVLFNDVDMGELPPSSVIEALLSSLVWNHRAYPANGSQNPPVSPSPFNPASPVAEKDIQGDAISGRMYLSGLTRRIVVRTSSQFPEDMVKGNSTSASKRSALRWLNIVLTGASGSSVVIDFPVSNVVITGCSKTEVFLPHVSGCVSVSHCEQVRIHTVAASVSFDNCVNSTGYLLTPTPPIISGDSRAITLAPYNAIGRHLPLHTLGLPLPAPPPSPPTPAVGMPAPQLVPLTKIDNPTLANRLCSWASPCCPVLSVQSAAAAQAANSDRTNPTTPTRGGVPTNSRLSLPAHTTHSPGMSPRTGRSASFDERSPLVAAAYAKIFRLMKPDALRPCLIPCSTMDRQLFRSYLVLPEEYSDILKSTLAVVKSFAAALSAAQPPSPTQTPPPSGTISWQDKQTIKAVLLEQFLDYQQKKQPSGTSTRAPAPSTRPLTQNGNAPPAAPASAVPSSAATSMRGSEAGSYR